MKRSMLSLMFGAGLLVTAAGCDQMQQAPANADAPAADQQVAAEDDPVPEGQLTAVEDKSVTGPVRWSGFDPKAPQPAEPSAEMLRRVRPAQPQTQPQITNNVMVPVKTGL